MNKKKIQIGGPGLLITAAFIGPGTVTVCTLAGATLGLQLLWAVVLSTGVTIMFQEMASRLGIITRLDLTSLIKRELKNPLIRNLMLGVILSSIVIGNAAYEAGNISGGVLGLDTFIIPSMGPFKITSFIIGIIVFLLLWFGNYKVLERSLISLVTLMSVSFLVTAILIRPPLKELFYGLLIPSIPDNSLLLVLGVIGTTIVPYNLFLHAALSKSNWHDADDIPLARKNTIISIAIGGLVSLAIVISASSLKGMAISNAIDLGKGLEPLYGSFAEYLISLGLFSAGITSAITAPLAASYVSAGCFNLPFELSSWKFKITWIIILILGVAFSSVGFKPIDIIRFAQVANGFMLPVIGFALVWLGSRTSILGTHKNKSITTVIGSILIILIAVLGIKSIWLVL